ncbi:hypothetical protein EDB19DRAFT_1910270 [Suillus lakei]|nr:hypothetical protein EDB19DRAFT_1910270 [Suillus lakei]
MSYISRWEHHVTLKFTPTNTDFWPVVLSASLQAFYTLYTAILVFLTQRLAMSRALVRRLKLTSIHDISGAWAGLGSALSSVCKQTGIPASLWATTAVTAYLVCISVLHITSSTILQFQTFNSSMTTYVPTTLGWVDVSTVDWTTTNWEDIHCILTSYHSISWACLHRELQRATSAVIVPYSNGFNANMTAIRPWVDQIQVLQPSSFSLDDPQSPLRPGIMLMVSTLLDIEPSVQKEVAVPMTWGYNPSTKTQIEVYFMQCSLSINTTEVLIDLLTNNLRNPMPISPPSTQWEEVYQYAPEFTSSVGDILFTSGASHYQFNDGTGDTSRPSIVDEYIMSLVGLNLTAQYYVQSRGDPPVSNFTLSRDKLEAAIAQTVAQLTWIAGHMGSNGGVQPGEGMALVEEEITALPLLFATFASVIMLGLALHTTRAFSASHGSQAAILDTGALQLLWLGHHSPSVHEVLQDVEHPTEANLRRAGMIDVCFARTTSEEEELANGEFI